MKQLDAAKAVSAEALEVVAAYFEHLDPRYLAEDVTVDLVDDRARRRGRTATAALLHDLRHRLFTDVAYEVTSLRAVGKEVVVELWFHGRPADGRRITVEVEVAVQVRGGEIATARVHYEPPPQIPTPPCQATAGQRSTP